MSAPEHPPEAAIEADPPSGWMGLAFLAGLFVLLGLTGGVSAVIVVVAIVIMIFVHELGHYVTAKSAGMKVTEFFLGFGPRVWSFRRGETEYGVKAIPAGAYVRIIGMNNLEEVEPEDEARAYRQAPFWRRFSVAVAGSAMHFIMAIVLLFVLFAGPGFLGFINQDEADELRLSSPDWVVSAVSEDSLAELVGVEPGDRVVAIDGVIVTTFAEVRDEIVVHEPGDFVTVAFERDGERLEASGELGRNPDTGTGFFGVGAGLPDVDGVDPLTAAGKSITEFGTVTKASITQIGQFFTPSGLGDFFSRVFETDEPADVAVEPPPPGSAAPAENVDDETGRIISIYGAARIGTALTDTGISGLLEFMVILNIFVGVFNLIPLLPLDGGHVVIAIYERLRSRSGARYHADVAKLLPLTYVVLFVLLSVGVAALYLDIRDPVL